MEGLLFGERDVKNLHHALQSVIYNAKKKLEKEGLPKENYIVIRDGMVKWTDKIPVWEDAYEFDALYRKIQKEKDLDEKLQLLHRAISLYTGEFVPMCAGVIWIAAESRKYQDMFSKCVTEMADICRQKKDYEKLERLGKYASDIAPFCDWETLTMEAMTSMGRYEDAAKLYEETVERYFDERGVYPSYKLIDFFDEFGNQLDHSYEILDNIQKKLSEADAPKQKKGAYLCSYPIFRGIYQHMVRLLERSGQDIYIMLCTIVDSKGNPMKDGLTLKSLSDRLETAICQSIRCSDVVNRYSKGQYLVLLINATKEECRIIQKRINYKFLTGRQRTGVRYHVNSVLMKKEIFDSDK